MPVAELLDPGWGTSELDAEDVVAGVVGLTTCRDPMDGSARTVGSDGIASLGRATLAAGAMSPRSTLAISAAPAPATNPTSKAPKTIPQLARVRGTRRLSQRDCR